jgi:dTDP-4-amino-4,6-dideoxygalactose transaminase
MAEKRIYLSSPHIGTDELGLVKEAFASNWIAPLGPHVDAFERKLGECVGIPHADRIPSMHRLRERKESLTS